MGHLTALLCVFALAATAAAEDLLHKLEGSAFLTAGVIEGDLKRGDAVLVRPALDPSSASKLQELAAQDQFYTIKLGPHATASVRASCFAAPPDTIKEALTVTLSAGQVVGLSYIVQSPSCGRPVSSSVPVQLPEKTLPVIVQVPYSGPQIASERVIPGNQPGSVPSSSQSGSPGNRPRQGGAGALNRPLGVVPPAQGEGQEGAERAPQQPPQEQSWLQKNWMFVAGGVMVVFNIMGNVARQAQQAQQGGGPGGPGGRPGGGR